MYDIQNALRRRAMAERLEALNRADEATSRAAELSDVPIGPRHRAQPGGSSRSANAYAAAPPEPSPDVVPSVTDDAPPARESARVAPEPLERPRVEVRVELHPDLPGETRLDLTEPVSSLRESGVVALPPLQPSAPVTPAAPFPSMLAPPAGFTPSPYSTAPHGMTTAVSPYVAAASAADERTTVTTVTGGSGGGTVVDERPRTDTVLSVRGLDQTARLDVTGLRTDPAVPPPARGEADVAVPSGVTLLRGPLSLPAEEPAALDPSSLVITAPATPVAAPAAPAPEATGPTAPAVDAPPVDVQPVDVQPVDAPPVDAPPVDPARAGAATAEVATADSDQAETDEPLNGSSAATIADLLRHGNSRRLFFDR